MTVSKTNIKLHKLSFGSMSFKQSEKLWYLGVTLDKKLNFKTDIKIWNKNCTLYQLVLEVERTIDPEQRST